MAESRQYDIVVFGATGYTGKLTAEHIATSLPTDLKWAIAGRSATKLDAVAAECKGINADRIQPGIEICNLDDKDLTALAKKTKVLISTVGPYAKHGEHAFKACAENGTHYLDATGECPFHLEMIRKYGKVAESNGSIMIPQIGLESAPSDLMAWLLVDMIKSRFSAPTGDVSVSIHEFSAGPSGGTLASVLGLLDQYSLAEIQAAHAPYGMSPIPAPKAPDSRSLLTKVFGIKVIPDLGVLTTSFGSVANIPIVQRTWGLLGGASSYGPNFRYHEYLKARNSVTAIGLHFVVAFMTIFLLVPPFRALASKFVLPPGTGPSKEKGNKDIFEYRGIGTPDISGSKPPRAFIKMRYEGSIYGFTGILLAEGAISIIRNETKLSGGVYTPAHLGQQFVDRLLTAGLKIDKNWLEF